MSEIRCIYEREPDSPPTNQHPDARRYYVDKYVVDAIGEPTLEEVLRVLDLDAGAVDRKAAAAVDGLERLQFEHLFQLENRVRALEGGGPITISQYRGQLIARWKELNPQ